MEKQRLQRSHTVKPRSGRQSHHSRARSGDGPTKAVYSLVSPVYRRGSLPAQKPRALTPRPDQVVMPTVPVTVISLDPEDTGEGDDDGEQQETFHPYAGVDFHSNPASPRPGFPVAHSTGTSPAVSRHQSTESTDSNADSDGEADGGTLQEDNTLILAPHLHPKLFLPSTASSTASLHVRRPAASSGATASVRFSTQTCPPRRVTVGPESTLGEGDLEADREKALVAAGILKADAAAAKPAVTGLQKASIIADRLLFGRGYVVVCIFLSLLNLALFVYSILEHEVYHDDDDDNVYSEDETWLFVVDIIITLLLILELAVRGLATRKTFFKSWFNIVDLILTILSIVPLAFYFIEVDPTQRSVTRALLALRYTARLVRLYLALQQLRARARIVRTAKKNPVHLDDEKAVSAVTEQLAKNKEYEHELTQRQSLFLQHPELGAYMRGAPDQETPSRPTLAEVFQGLPVEGKQQPQQQHDTALPSTSAADTGSDGRSEEGQAPQHTVVDITGGTEEEEQETLQQEGIELTIVPSQPTTDDDAAAAPTGTEETAAAQAKTEEQERKQPTAEETAANAGDVAVSFHFDA